MATLLRPVPILLLASLGFCALVPVLAHASDHLPCRDILTPEDPFSTSSPIQTEPIEDCEQPFGSTNSSAAVVVGTTTVRNGDTVTVPAGGVTEYTYTDFQSAYVNFSASLYKHEDDNYVYFASLLTESDFNAPSNIPRPPLTAGTYTAVLRDENVFPVQAPRWRQFFGFLFPVAHACYYCEELLATVTFTVEEAPPEPEEPEGASSVLFLPGIQGSRLYTDRFTGEDQLWEPSTFGNDLTNLRMTDEGESVRDVYTKRADIIDRADYFGDNDIVPYETFISFLDELEASGDIASWQPYAYDWRQDVRVMCKHIWRIPVQSGNGDTYGRNSEGGAAQVGTSHRGRSNDYQ